MLKYTLQLMFALPLLALLPGCTLFSDPAPSATPVAGLSLTPSLTSPAPTEAHEPSTESPLTSPPGETFSPRPTLPGPPPTSAPTSTPTDVPAPPTPTPTPATPEPTGPTATPGCPGDLTIYGPAQQPRWFLDQDADGFGQDALVGLPCTDGYVAARGDCDDHNPAIHPGAADADADGVDQDCGGTEGAEPHIGFPFSVYPGVQAALDAAQPGITLWMSGGEYLEHDLTFRGKDLALRGTHPHGTVLNAQGQGRLFEFSSGETPKASLDGLTLTGGQTSDHGAAVYVTDASPTLVDCTFKRNITTSGGGGAYFIGSRSLIIRSTFEQNEALVAGGVSATKSSLIIDSCYFAHNFAAYWGGGLSADGSELTLIRSQFYRNGAKLSGGGADFSGSYLTTVSGCIFEGNTCEGSPVCMQRPASSPITPSGIMKAALPPRSC